MRDEIFELRMKGCCCSQIVAEIGLRDMGMENPQLVKAFAGLCDGVKCGRICGAVSAAVCMMYLADPDEAGRGLAEEFTGWFEDAFGTLECSGLLPGGDSEKLEKCPVYVDAAVTRMEELMEWD